jgi:hypothetical protein
LFTVTCSPVRNSKEERQFEFIAGAGFPSLRFSSFIRAAGVAYDLDDADHLAGRYLAVKNGGKEACDFDTPGIRGGAPPVRPKENTMDRNFAKSLALVLKSEGGWSDNPADPGGATMKGVTLTNFRRYVKADATKDDLRHITDAQVATVLPLSSFAGAWTVPADACRLAAI